jgi:hypothetical protein
MNRSPFKDGSNRGTRGAIETLSHWLEFAGVSVDVRHARDT